MILGLVIKQLEITRSGAEIDIGSIIHIHAFYVYFKAIYPSNVIAKCCYFCNRLYKLLRL